MHLKLTVCYFRKYKNLHILKHVMNCLFVMDGHMIQFYFIWEESLKMRFVFWQIRLFYRESHGTTSPPAPSLSLCTLLLPAWHHCASVSTAVAVTLSLVGNLQPLLCRSTMADGFFETENCGRIQDKLRDKSMAIIEGLSPIVDNKTYNKSYDLKYKQHTYYYQLTIWKLLVEECKYSCLPSFTTSDLLLSYLHF